MPIIRVTSRPNLAVVLSPSGFESYSDKKARIAMLLDEGERAQREQEREQEQEGEQ